MPEFDPVFRIDDITVGTGLRIIGADPSSDFARASAGAGDVNGDGVADLIFGADGFDGEGSERGAAFVLFGGTYLAALDAADGAVDGQIDITELNGTNGFQIEGSTNNGNVGVSVSAAGDVDGDGFDDILIGAEGALGINNSGQAALIFGRSTFAASVPFIPVVGDGYLFSGVGTISGDGFGFSVGGGGDFDGDGFTDIIIGAPRADPSTELSNGNEGAAYLVRGGLPNLNDLDDDDGAAGGSIQAGFISDSKGAVFAGETTNNSALAGESVSNAGDVNGDGYDDIIIGSDTADPRSTTANESEGAAYLVFGRADVSMLSNPTRLSSANGSDVVEIYGVDQGDRFGTWVSGGGDINGDGFSDVVISATFADSFGANSSGSAYVFFGKPAWGPAVDPALLDGTDGFRLDGLRGSDYTGISVSIAGDINGDGFDDIAVAAHFFDQVDSSNNGAIYIVFGKASGFAPVIDLGALNGDNGFRIDGPSQTSSILGRGMSGPAGDINGDGFDDLVMGAYREDTVQDEPNHGAGYVIYGHMAQGSVHRIGTHLGQTQNGGIGDDLIQGNDGDDTLIGHDGNDQVFGGAGLDLIVAGQGEDLSDGGSGFDTMDFYSTDLGGVGVVLDLFNQRASMADGSQQIVRSIEKVIGTDSVDEIIGDLKNNDIRGRGGDDTLRGSGGNDSLLGGNGADTLRGGDGNDTLLGQAGNDDMNGQSGDDRLDGGDGNDILFGHFGNDTLIGGIGDDLLRGNENNDLLDGGNGADDLRGGSGNDSLFARGQDDFLFGDSGADRLDGGTGNDSMTGGAGADTFIFRNSNYGFDRIKDFTNGSDRVDLSDFGFGAFASVSALSSQQGSAVRVDFGSGNVLFIEDFALASWNAADVIL